MKFLRVGQKGKEKPAILDKDGKIRDISSQIKDLNPDTLNFKTLEKINWPEGFYRSDIGWRAR